MKIKHYGGRKIINIEDSNKKRVLSFENIIIAKTILTIIPKIDDMRLRIAKKNKAIALRSFYSTHGTYAIAELILDNIYHSNELYNLKTIVIKQIKMMPAKLSRVIKLYYLKQQTVDQIAILLDMSTRNCFRMINIASQNFAANLNKIGINYLNFKLLIEQNNWIYAEFKHQQNMLNKFMSVEH